LPGHRARDHVRARRRQKGRTENRGPKIAPHFFQHKHQAGQRRIERRGKSRACAGSRQGQSVGWRNFHAARKAVGDRTPHLHSGTLAAERKPAADREHAAEHFDDQHTRPREIAQSVQNSFQMGNAAATRFGRIAHDQTNRRRCAGGTEGKRKDPPEFRCGVRPVDETVAERIAGGKRGSKEHRDSSRCNPDSSRARKQLMTLLADLEIIFNFGFCFSRSTGGFRYCL
jgi:hypothetical protein